MILRPGKQAEYDEYKAKNYDEYGSCVVRFAERWAGLMETRIKQGAKVADIAKAMSHKADTERISGAAFSFAVESLGWYWIHGVEVMAWYKAEQRKVYGNDVCEHTTELEEGRREEEGIEEGRRKKG